MSRHDDLFMITLGSEGGVQRSAREEVQLDLFNALYEHVPERSQLLAEGSGWPGGGSGVLRDLQRAELGVDEGNTRTVSRSPRRRRRRAA